MQKSSTPSAVPPVVPDGYSLLDPAYTALIRQLLQTGRLGTYSKGDDLGDYAREVDAWRAATGGKPEATSFGRARARARVTAVAR